MLDSSQKKLYRDVMKETFLNLISIEKTQEENFEEDYQNLRTQVVEKDGECEHGSQCEQTQAQIPKHIVTEDMPPAITLCESSLDTRKVIGNSPLDVHLSNQTQEKPFECKELVEKAFKHEKCWEDMGHSESFQVHGSSSENS
ncbi:rCG53377, isoform CRA_a, partial [Rattus norvegicus]